MNWFTYATTDLHLYCRYENGGERSSDTLSKGNKVVWKLRIRITKNRIGHMIGTWKSDGVRRLSIYAGWDNKYKERILKITI